MRRAIDLLKEDRLRLSSSDNLTELKADIVRASYIEGDFVLTGGIHRHYYFDKYLFETRPAILRRLARLLGTLVPRDTDRLAAPALGAVALGTAISLDLGLPMVIVRVTADPESTKTVEGELYQGESVTLIEDVVVTGTRAMAAVDRIRDAGAKTTDIVAVIDRAEGAAERFTGASISYKHLFTPGSLGIR